MFLCIGLQINLKMTLKWFGTFEIKLCNFFSLYRSPDHSKDDFENICNNFDLGAVLATNPFSLSPLLISTQILATGILLIQLPLKALKLRPQLLNFDYSKSLMNRLTFKDNLCPASILSSPLNQIWWWVLVSTRLFTKIDIIR